LCQTALAGRLPKQHQLLVHLSGHLGATRGDIIGIPAVVRFHKQLANRVALLIGRLTSAV
jgi:hypothetical protein